MTLLWYDGFEGYDGYAAMRKAGYYIPSTTNFTIDTTYYRNGAQSVKMVDDPRYFRRLFSSACANDTMVLGVGLRVSSLSTDHPYPFVAFTNSAGSVQVGFHFNMGTLRAYRGDKTTLLGESDPDIIAVNIWYFLEFKVYCHDSAGTIEVRLNGDSDNPILDLTSLDTKAQSTSDLQGFYCRTHRDDGTIYYDDLYVLDTGGSAPQNDFLGDIKVVPQRVDGAGSNTDFTPSAGSNYENVDETPSSDEDTTYNEGSSVGDKDSYSMGTVETGGTIFGKKVSMDVKKTDVGEAGIKHLLHINGSDYLGDEKILTTDYVIESFIWETNPDDSQPFEDADLDDDGIEVTTLV